MKHSLLVLGVLAASVGYAMVGCDSSANDPIFTPTSSSSEGPATTGTSAGGGGAGQGGGAQGGGAGVGGSTCAPIAGHDPVAAGDPACCTSGNTGQAHCVATADVVPQLAHNFDACTDKSGGAGLCVPDKQIEAGSDFSAQTCTATIGGAGVCVSICVEAVASDPNHGLLMQDGCAGGDELCVPCTNPLTGESTHACDPVTCNGGTGGGGAGGGPACPYVGPPLIDPTTLDMCSPACGGAHCVPASAVPPAEQAQLAACTAMGGAGFCTPDKFIAAGGNLIAATCTSIAGAEGRCISDCLPAVAAQDAILPKATCDTGEVCVPCTDPTTGMDTGVCHLSCDPGPADPPVVLTCPWTGPDVVDPAMLGDCMPACGGAHCMPAFAVPMAEQAMLTACPGGFCLPDSLITTGGEIQPDSCMPFEMGSQGEGRCLSSCLGSVAAQASQLEQTTCATGDLCTPCYDPISGADTGACRLSSCDMPMSPAYTFATCCPGTNNGPNAATCVPKEIIPASEAGSLQRETCDTNSLCVPDEYLPGSTIPVQTCNAALIGNDPGACVSNCVSGAIGTQGTCPDNHVCVSCALAMLAGETVPGCM
jgi:hypothetical protein